MYRQISSFVISYSHEQNTLLCLFITRVCKNIAFAQNTQMAQKIRMKIHMACRATIRRKLPLQNSLLEYLH